MNDRNITRHFICLKCKKPSTDKQGGFSRYDIKNDMKLFYENVDLCKKCFKQEVKAQRQIGMLQDLIKKGVLDTEDKVKRFQADLKFRRDTIRLNFQAKKGDLKKRNALILDKLKKGAKK